jgi:hypothetical protein
MQGAIPSLDPRGHGIIQADGGSRVPVLSIDVFSRHVLVVGLRVALAV